MKKRNVSRLLSLLLVAGLLLGTAVQAVPATAGTDGAAAVTGASGAVTLETARAAMEAARAKAGLIQADADTLDPDETIRVMVETSVTPAVERMGSTVYTASLQQAEQKAVKAQEAVIDRVEDVTGTEMINQSAYLVSTFTIEMKAGQMDEVAELPGVASVTPVTTFELCMNYATQMTTVHQMWEDLGYTGEGTVIAVIDTGVNVYHPDMVLDEGVDVKITEEDAQAFIAQLGYGKYYSEKVPFGYSYTGYYEMDNRTNVHGLHVSGIAAANGGEDGVTGVAPNAQVLALQVFSSGGGAYTDDIIRAVEDAVKLGADVVNLSLGSTAGFYDDVDFLQTALTHAAEDGVLCCVAAGNDGTSASLLGINTNDLGVVDTGAVSAPSTAPSALSVASVNNEYVKGSVLSLTDAEGNVLEAEAFNFSQKYEELHAQNPEGTGWDTLDDVVLLDFGRGTRQEVGAMFETILEIAMSGQKWVGLVERGDITFREKVDNVYNNPGAGGVIIYNNEPGSAVPYDCSSDTAGESPRKLYQVLVSNDFGLKLKALCGTTVSFGDLKDTFVASADGGQMSVFSSWGPTPSLDIKPEISAPGGNIYSLSSGDGYVSASGTSMAAPYVSGASALVLQAVREAEAEGRLNLGGLSEAAYAKLVLMNTADPVVREDGVPYSVRQQGAGMVDPAGAASATVTATYEGVAAAALKEVGANTSFTLLLTNYGTEDQTYTLHTEPVYTDVTLEDGEYTVEAVPGASVTYGADSVTVPAGGIASVSAVLTVSGLEQGHYVEAFLHLDSAEGTDLGLPLLGFYGDWYGGESMIDAPIYSGSSIYGAAGYPSTTMGADGYYTGMNYAGEILPEYMSFSPNGDRNMDEAVPLLAFMRCVETLRIDVLDEAGQVLRTTANLEQLSKCLAVDVAVSGSPYTRLYSNVLDGVTWDGTVYDQATGDYTPCGEGKYFMRFTSTMPGSNQEQVLTMPIQIDVTAPELVITGVDAGSDGTVSVSFTLTDNLAPYDAVIVYVNEEEYEFPLADLTYDSAAGVYTAAVESAPYVPGRMNEIAVYAEDYAANGVLVYYYTEVDTDAMLTYSTLTNQEDSWYESFYMEKIQIEEVLLNRINLKWEIRGVANAAVARLTVNGEEALLRADHSFAHTVKLVIGKNEFEVVAYDAAGQELLRETKLLYLSNGSTVTAKFYPTCWPDEYDKWVEGSYYPGGMWVLELGGNPGECCFGYYTYYENSVPMVMEVSDDILKVELTYFDPDVLLTREVYSQSFDLSTSIPGASYETITLTTEDFADGKAYFDLPMALYEFDYEDNGLDPDEYPNIRINECFVSVTDVLGVESRYQLRVQNGDYTRMRLALYGPISDDEILTAGPDSHVVHLGFKSMYPLQEMETPFVFGPEDVDENGCIHIWGEMADSYFNRILANSEVVSSGGPEFEFDYHLYPGANYMTIYAGQEGSGSMVSYTYLLYYLPEPTTVSFTDSRIRDGAVIYTTADTFTLDGTLTGYFLGRGLQINGDTVIFESVTLSAPDGGPFSLDFSYAVELQDGENVITVELMTTAGETVYLQFTVFKGTGSYIPITPVGPSGAGSASGGASLPFIDVQTGDWFYDDVAYVYENGLMQGVSDTQFAPNSTLTRGMIVTILYRMEGEPGVRTGNTFRDVSGDAWYGDAVEWAAANGIVLGYGDGRFGPEDTITREQLACVLYRYAALQGRDVSARANLQSFHDAASVSSYAVEAMQWAVAEGLINGSDGRLMPQSSATRAQVAAIIHRFLEA